MQIKVNQEIRDIKDEFLSGLSVRQTIWSAAALCAGFITFWNVYTRFGSTDMASFLTLCASAPLALIGFFKWHKIVRRTCGVMLAACALDASQACF